MFNRLKKKKFFQKVTKGDGGRHHRHLPAYATANNYFFLYFCVITNFFKKIPFTQDSDSISRTNYLKLISCHLTREFWLKKAKYSKIDIEFEVVIQNNVASENFVNVVFSLDKNDQREKKVILNDMVTHFKRKLITN